MIAPGAGNGLPLRDIHLPAAPSPWPPAPGWWIVGIALLAICAFAFAMHWRRRRRRRAVARLFDDAVADAPTPAARVAAMSELLRRAARRVDPAADTLHGDDWLRFLDGDQETGVFRSGPGALLRDGAFRADVADGDVEALRVHARARFIRWMTR